MKTMILALVIPLLLYYFNDAIKDIYTNFGIYVPFFNVTSYIDLTKYVFIPLFTGKHDAVTEVLYTPEELKKYKGEKDIIYISILGKVFDVSLGASFYGPGKAYHWFAGRDASRAFVKGDFTDAGLTDDVLDMPLTELIQLKDWLKMYENKYEYKGKLTGRFYDSNGAPTDYNQKLTKKFEEAEAKEYSEKNDKELFPSCNVEWTPENGSRVWCSIRSGGIERSWVGVPRKLFKPGNTSYRCACVDIGPQSVTIDTDDDKLPKHFVEYEGCDPNSSTCYINP